MHNILGINIPNTLISIKKSKVLGMLYTLLYYLYF